MKKIIYAILITLLFIPSVNAKEKEQVNLYIFHSNTCPHCKAEIEYLDSIKSAYPNLKITKLEIHNSKNENLYTLVAESLGEEAKYIPYTVIGTYTQVGFNDNTKKKIIDYINTCGKYGCYDLVNDVKKENKSLKEKADKEKKELSNKIKNNKEKENDSKMKLPLIGEVDVKKYSLPLISIAIGLVDGFNPCAMWILIFLISILIGMKDRKRMWAIGFTFLFTSALVYFLFMTAWLGVSVNFSSIRGVQIVIALVALIGAFFNFRSFNKERKKDAGCQVVDKEKRVSIMNKIKVFTKEDKLFLAILGAASLAVSVNVIELACSAGLPLLFTQILALNNLSPFMYFIYMLLYILAFMLDDMIVFVIAMFTLKLTGITNKYNKYSHLIGGLIMLLVGILLLFKPEWIMLNF